MPTRRKSFGTIILLLLFFSGLTQAALTLTTPANPRIGTQSTAIFELTDAGGNPVIGMPCVLLVKETDGQTVASYQFANSTMLPGGTDAQNKIDEFRLITDTAGIAILPLPIDDKYMAGLNYDANARCGNETATAQINPKEWRANWFLNAINGFLVEPLYTVVFIILTSIVLLAWPIIRWVWLSLTAEDKPKNEY